MFLLCGVSATESYICLEKSSEKCTTSGAKFQNVLNFVRPTNLFAMRALVWWPQPSWCAHSNKCSFDMELICILQNLLLLPVLVLLSGFIMHNIRTSINWKLRNWFGIEMCWCISLEILTRRPPYINKLSWIINCIGKLIFVNLYLGIPHNQK